MMESRSCISQLVDKGALVAILTLYTSIVDLKLYWAFRLSYIKKVILFWWMIKRVLPENIFTTYLLTQ